MNDDLNRRVAEELGKRLVTIASDDDWHSVEESTPPGVEAYVPLPNYAGDLNAAWALLQDLLSADYVPQNVSSPHQRPTGRFCFGAGYGGRGVSNGMLA